MVFSWDKPIFINVIGPLETTAAVSVVVVKKEMLQSPHLCVLKRPTACCSIKWGVEAGWPDCSLRPLPATTELFFHLHSDTLASAEVDLRKLENLGRGGRQGKISHDQQPFGPVSSLDKRKNKSQLGSSLCMAISSTFLFFNTFNVCDNSHYDPAGREEQGCCEPVSPWPRSDLGPGSSLLCPEGWEESGKQAVVRVSKFHPWRCAPTQGSQSYEGISQPFQNLHLFSVPRVLVPQQGLWTSVCYD